MYYAGIMDQCRDEGWSASVMTLYFPELTEIPDVQICDDTLSALEARAEGDLSTHAARSELLKDLLEVVRPRASMYPSRAPFDGPNTARDNGEREESLEIHPWNMEEEYDEEDDEDDYDEWDGGYWVHEDEHMSDFVDEDEEEYDEDEDEEDDYDENHQDDFRGHDQGLEDSLMCSRLGTPPTIDRGEIVALIKESQQGPRASRENDTGYLIKVGIFPNMIEAGPGAVFRILRVPTRMTFEQLAETINTAFEWAGGYSHEFRLSKPCRKRVRCMCMSCEPVVAKFHQGSSYATDREEEFYANFDADKVTLSDVWGNEACRGMSVWYRYDFEANWQHLIHFLGEADGNLGPAMALPRSQEVWCLSGQGDPWPENLRRNLIARRDQTDLYQGDREAINTELGKQII
jgi:hypothetical protein